jgi:competence protein ComEC
MGAASLVLPALLGGVAAGVFVADGLGPTVVVPGAALAGTLLVILGATLGWRVPLLCGVAIGALALGAWRADVAARPAVGTESVAALLDGAEHRVIGTVLDDPRPREDRLQIVIGDLGVARGDRAEAVAGRVLVWVTRGVDVTSGDVVIVEARLELPEDFDGFAYREYLSRQGIGAIARARSLEVVAEASGPTSVLAGLRSSLLGGLNDLVPEPQAALGAGILLGVRSAIAPEIEDAFATAGLTHVVAISGWNIAIVAALVAAAVRPLARRPGGRWTTATVAAVTVAGYVVLTGASPSVVRAALMAGAMLVARLGGSRAHAASALALAALVMLVAAPPVLWDVGFQLSLLATAGLIWFGAPIERRLHGWPTLIREPIALTLAAQLTTLPVMLVNFERLSLVAPIANVLVVPFVPVAMLFSAAASVAGLAAAVVPTPAADVVGWLTGGCAWLVLSVIVWLGTTVASVPLAAVDVRVPPVLAVAWIPFVGLTAWAFRGPPSMPAETDTADSPMLAIARRLIRPLPVAGAVTGVLLAVTVVSRPDGLLHLTVLDIGQGDAILVEAPDGTTTLVDGGPDPELTLRRLGANLPFFGRRIDLVVLSHPHQDHVAGLVDVVNRFRIGAVVHAGIPFENAAFNRLVADAGRAATPILTARAGQVLQVGAGTTIEVLYPTDADAAAPLPDGDINNGSIVLVLRFGSFSALLTGDAEAPVEHALLDRALVPPTDVLKVGHHGSTSSTTPAFLAAASPSIAVISSGEGNEYGHPAPQTLDTLRSVSVYRTDLHGDVEIVTDGRAFRVRTDAGWTAGRAVQRMSGAGSIGPWPSPTETRPGDCSTRQSCPRGSLSTPRAWHASPWRPPGWWPRPRSRWTARWSRRRLCSTTSTRSRSAAPVASTVSSARAGSRPRATRSSRCRSPPIHCRRSSTTTGTRSAGPPSSSPWPTATWRRSSSPSTSAWTT